MYKKISIKKDTVNIAKYFIKPKDTRRILIVEEFMKLGWDPDEIYDKLRKSMIRDVSKFSYLDKGHIYCKNRFNNKEGLISFRDIYLKFIDFHDRLYDGVEIDFVKKLLKQKFDELPEQVLKNIKEILLLNIQMDKLYYVITTNFKPLIKINVERIKTERNFEHSEYLNMYSHSEGLFVSEYKTAHMSYLEENEKDKKEIQFNVLLDKYHLGSKELANQRLKNKFLNIHINGFRKISKKTTELYKDPELKALADIVNFDNYFELLHYTRLEGISGVGLRYYLMSELKKQNKINETDDLLLPENELKMLKLLDDQINKVKRRLFIRTMSLYRQTTPVTCAPSSLMTVENYFNKTAMTKKRELDIYEFIKVEQLGGSYDPLLALFAKKEGLQVRLLISSKEIFGKLIEIPESKFKELEESFGNAHHEVIVKIIAQYMDYLNKAKSEGVVCINVDVNTDILIEQMKEGYIPILNILFGKEQHMVVVTGYNLDERIFYISDPIRGQIKLTKEQLERDLQIPWGGIVITISNFLEQKIIHDTIKKATKELVELERSINYFHDT